MNTYTILITGPMEERVRRFSSLLTQRLEAFWADTGYSGKAADHYQMVSVLPEGTRSSLTICIDADPRDLAMKVLRNHRTGSSLAEEIDTIIAQQKNQKEQEKPDADITIKAQENLNEAASSTARYIVRTDPAAAGQRLQQEQRRFRINEMIRQYEQGRSTARKAKIKRAAWMAVIHATLGFKRIIDITGSLIALILLSPLFAVVALIIKLTDGGPAFYVQERIGKQGKSFPFPKFRSMVLNADQMKDSLLKDADRKGDVTFKMKHDPRVTPIGRFIRRFSIDELPQLWCVLKGDMSLVGPRPPVPREVALYTQEDRRRLEVTPGLTGIWQVSGRADIEFKQQVELDVLYIESHGILLDILLLLKTIPAVFTGRGAY